MNQICAWSRGTRNSRTIAEKWPPQPKVPSIKNSYLEKAAAWDAVNKEQHKLYVEERDPN